MSLFITFEGGEGCGKTVQARALYRRLQRLAIPALLTQEPGGTPLGKKLSRWLKWTDDMDISPLTELLLFNASRAQLVARVIRPSLKDGKVVICDRYADSTTAYQGYGRGLSRRLIGSFDRLMTGEFRPRFTVLLDLPPEHGLRRARVRNRRTRQSRTQGRFELERREFQRKVRKGYLQLARQEKLRLVVVPATGNRLQVHEDIWKRLAPRLPRSSRLG